MWLIAISTRCISFEASEASMAVPVASKTYPYTFMLPCITNCIAWSTACYAVPTFSMRPKKELTMTSKMCHTS